MKDHQIITDILDNPSSYPSDIKFALAIQRQIFPTTEAQKRILDRIGSRLRKKEMKKSLKEIIGEL